MANMIINSPEPKKTLLDYDITFQSGMMMPLTLDPALGDTITIGDRTIEIYRAPVRSFSDPESFLPSEEVTIFLNHVVSIVKRQREVTDHDPKDVQEWFETPKQVM